jgi:hypothetical protein
MFGIFFLKAINPRLGKLPIRISKNVKEQALVSDTLKNIKGAYVLNGTPKSCFDRLWKEVWWEEGAFRNHVKMEHLVLRQVALYCVILPWSGLQNDGCCELSYYSKISESMEIISCPQRRIW